jgi:hypothetical protein
MRKISFQVGDLIESIQELSISNDDGTDETSDGGEIFFVLEYEPQEGFNADEYKLIRQKSLKISSWNVSGLRYNFNKV